MNGPPEIRAGMPKAELDQLIEWNRHACGARACRQRATAIYYRKQMNAHYGISTFRFQRCDRHPVSNPDRQEPYDGKGRP